MEKKKPDEGPDLLEMMGNKKSDKEDKSARMAVKELIEAKKDADLKTHLSEVETLTFAKADFYAEELGNYGFDDAKQIVNFFSDRMMRKRFSFMRASRKEFGEGFKFELPVQMAEDRNKVERMLK